MTTTTITAPSARTATEQSSTKSLWKTGSVAGVAASVATLATAGIAQAIDVSLKVGGKAIPLLGFAQVTFVAAIIGTIIAVVLSHRANRPRRTFVTTTLALTAVSFVPDVFADAHTATKFALALTHVVAAAIVIPALSSRLTD
jgi:peptidoglycan/LPS O-acetylase OafA/YrhL